MELQETDTDSVNYFTAGEPAKVKAEKAEVVVAQGNSINEVIYVSYSFLSSITDKRFPLH